MCDVPLHEEDATLTYETLSSSYAVVSDPHRVEWPDFSDGDLDSYTSTNQLFQPNGTTLLHLAHEKYMFSRFM